MADLRTRFIEDYAGGLLNVARQDLSSTGEVLAQDGFSDTAETLFVEDGRGVKSGLRLGPALAECVDPSSETGVLNVRSADRTYAKIRDLKVFGTAVASAQAALSESVAESFTNLEDAFEALESDLQGARDQLLTQIESSNLLVQNNERRIETFEELVEKTNTSIASLSDRVEGVENLVKSVQVETRAIEVDVVTGILEDEASSNNDLQMSKYFGLLSVQTDLPAWITVYTTRLARSQDSRSVPGTGPGIIADVVTTLQDPVAEFQPVTVSYSDSDTVYVRIVNQSGETRRIEAKLRYIRF